MKTTVGIYKLEWPSGKYYIGQSIDLNNRFKYHLADMIKGNHFNYKIQNQYNKEGVPTFNIVKYCDIDTLDIEEINLINLKDMNILNILPGGGKMFGENSARAIYTDSNIEQAFLLLVNSSLTRKQISKETNIDISTIYDISAGRGRGKDFLPLKYPDMYTKLLNNKANNTKGKNTIKLTNGIINIELITGEYSTFCRNNNIHPSNLSKVISGVRKHTMGWRLAHENI